MRRKTMTAMAIALSVIAGTGAMVMSRSANASTITASQGTGHLPGGLELLENFTAVGSSISPNTPVHDTGAFKGSKLTAIGSGVSVVDGSTTLFPEGQRNDKRAEVLAGSQLELDFSRGASFVEFHWGRLVDGSSVSLFDTKGALLQSFTAQQFITAVNAGVLNSPLSVFANFASTTPIGKIIFAGGIAVDDIKAVAAAVSEVPLPAAFPLFAAAIGGMGMMGRKRRQVKAVA